MDSIDYFFIMLILGFTFLFIILPGVILFFLIRFFIKKSSPNQSTEVLKSRKDNMLEKINKSKKKLVPWQAEHLGKISNKISYNYVRGFARTFNGSVNSSDNELIFVFRRVDRGMSIDTKIMAATSHLNFYFEISAAINKIYINDIHFGTIKNNTTIINASGIPFGTMDRDQSQAAIYSIKAKYYTIAKVIKNSDRRAFYKETSNSFVEQDVIYNNSLVNPVRELNDEEYKWVLAIAIFESVFYGIDF